MIVIISHPRVWYDVVSRPQNRFSPLHELANSRLKIELEINFETNFEIKPESGTLVYNTELLYFLQTRRYEFITDEE